MVLRKEKLNNSYSLTQMNVLQISIILIPQIYVCIIKIEKL